MLTIKNLITLFGKLLIGGHYYLFHNVLLNLYWMSIIDLSIFWICFRSNMSLWLMFSVLSECGLDWLIYLPNCLKIWILFPCLFFPACSLLTIRAFISIQSLTLWLVYSCLRIKCCSFCGRWFLLHPGGIFSDSFLGTCGWLACSNKFLGQHLPCDLTDVNADWIFCCTSCLVWEN